MDIVSILNILGYFITKIPGFSGYIYSRIHCVHSKLSSYFYLHAKFHQLCSLYFLTKILWDFIVSIFPPSLNCIRFIHRSSFGWYIRREEVSILSCLATRCADSALLQVVDNALRGNALPCQIYRVVWSMLTTTSRASGGYFSTSNFSFLIKISWNSVFRLLSRASMTTKKYLKPE